MSKTNKVIQSNLIESSGEKASKVLLRLFEVTRSIRREVERELWARSAGRCQFKTCNKILYKSPITQESVNISDKAHIYSFSESGPRGWGPFKKSRVGINNLENLMLVCHDCHKTIDNNGGARYPAELLTGWKKQHEQRICMVTGISPDSKSHVVLYGANIGEQRSILQYQTCAEAMFPHRFPISENPVNLSMTSEHVDSQSDFWGIEADNLKKAFERYIIPRIHEEDSTHFSLFALAPQPLLILLGSLFTDKFDIEVYQPHREPKTWKWQKHPDAFEFIIKEPTDFGHDPVLVISLSDEIAHDRVSSIIGKEVSIWEITTNDCHNDIIQSAAQLSMFRSTIRKLMVLIKKKHGQSTPVKIFPAMPVSCAIEFGRVRMPKAEMPWIIYDQNNKHKKFVETITL